MCCTAGRANNYLQLHSNVRWNQLAGTVQLKNIKIRYSLYVRRQNLIVFKCRCRSQFSWMWCCVVWKRGTNSPEAIVSFDVFTSVLPTSITTNSLHSHAVFCWGKVMNLLGTMNAVCSVKVYVRISERASVRACVRACQIHVFHFGLAVVLNTQLFKAVTFGKEFSYILSIYQSSCPVFILWQCNIIFTYRSAASSITLNEKQLNVIFFCFLLGPWLWHHRPRIAAWGFCLVSVAAVMLCGPLGHSQHFSKLGGIMYGKCLKFFVSTM